MAINTNFPNVRPSLLLDFANAQQLDPRVTFSRSTTAPYYDGKTSVLAEQNLLVQSNAFTTSWSVNALATPTQGATDPAGGSTAWTLTTTLSTNSHILYQGPSSVISSVTPYTVSFYLQAGAGVGSTTYASLNCNNGAGYATVTFNLTGAGSVTQTSNSVYTSVSSSITQIGSSAWYRCSMTFTPNSTATNYTVVQLNNSGTPTLNASGYQSWTALGTETLLVYGAQLEQRSSVTAYNATTTTAITNYIPQLLTAPINAPRFDFNPTTGESLGLLIEQSSTNILLQSQFASGWTTSNATLTPAANIAPDGTQTVNQLIESTANSQHYFYSASTLITATSYTLTVYAKQTSGSQRWVTLYPQGTGVAAYAIFNINNGTVSSTGGAQYLSSTVTPVGNGMYRCSLTFTGAAVTIFNFIYLSNVSNNTSPTYTGDGYSGIYIWGATLEALAFPTSYIATTSAQVTRASDNASMTGTNFSSWFNAGQGTIYCEGNPYALNGGAGNPMTFVAISDNTTNNRIRITSNITSGGIFECANGGTSQFGLGTAITPNTFTKMAGSFATNNSLFSQAGGTATTDTSCLIPTVTQMQIGNLLTGRELSGWIKKIAIYPQATTATNVQSLSGS